MFYKTTPKQNKNKPKPNKNTQDETKPPHHAEVLSDIICCILYHCCLTSQTVLWTTGLRQEMKMTVQLCSFNGFFFDYIHILFSLAEHERTTLKTS